MNNEKKISRPISFLPIYIGLLFFANPYIGTLDILPDFIGCLLIIGGLSRLSRISCVMEEARTKFWYLLALALGKDILSIMTMGSSANADRPVLYLIVAFVSAILHIWLGYCAMHALYDGLYGLAVKGECPAFYTAAPRRAPFKNSTPYSRTELILRRTLIFIVVREVVCTLPEFSSLSTTILHTDPGFIDMYQYIGIMRLLAVLAVSIVGICYVVSLSRYFLLLQKEKAFREGLAEMECAYYRDHPGSRIERRYSLCFLLMSIGGFLLTDFYLDFTNVLPDLLAAAFFLAGILLMDLPRRPKLICAALAGGYGLVATLSSFFARDFALHFNPGDIDKTAEGARAYALMWGSSLLEFLVFLAFFAILLFRLRDVIVKWAGYLPTHNDLEFEQRRREAFLEEFDKDLIRLFVIAFFSGLLSFIYDYMQIIPGGKWFRFLEFFWAYDFCLCLVFAALFSATLSNIQKQIRYRFSLDA
ncbi:MAG: hypothetical protein E7624_00210 [Ruminococcaceae bacterium]|nr:hypothetical protein [Oscillospiraceae bacterium]